jgi:hypothetical protein
MPKQTTEGHSSQKAVKQRENKPKPLTARDLMKLEIANEIGLLDKVQAVGWAGLSAQEAGVIGGIMSHRLRANQGTIETPQGSQSKQQET